MNRDASEFCRHALSEFAFLRDAGYSETHEAGPSQFSIEFATSDSQVVAINAFFPRSEYCVYLSVSDDEFVGLDELVAMVEPDLQLEHQWTWAHSNADVFKTHISYSAELLRKCGLAFFNKDKTLWSRVSAHRERLADASAHDENRTTAAEAFKSGRWNDAIAIYESLPNLSPVEFKRLAIAKRRIK